MSVGEFCYLGAVKKVPFWLFDLDNTLYPAETGLFNVVDARINRFLMEHLGIPAAAADALRHRYHEEYGITLVGLMKEHAIDPHHYLEFVHRIPVAEYLVADAALRAILEELPGRKAIFTNGSRRHALAVIGALGLDGVFGEIFDIVTLGFRPKPDPRTYHAVLTRLGRAGPEVVLLEDLARNLAPARALGMTTVLVGGPPAAAADFAIATLKDLPAILPAILA